ncbi:MAG: sugar phosphate isomerase/epimerase [Verrucomicrobiota bacterium]|nr:sugar phosphate isomerase/epimerase [Verrucomicrobiota bacterium]
MQLYSLRREAETDPEGTLKKIRSLGYDGVELAGDYDWPAEKWRTLLSKNGLQVIAAHLDLDTLEKNLKAQLAFHEEIENELLVVSSIPDELRTPGGFREAARRLNKIGERLAHAGFQLLYHNHAFEFDELDTGGTGMDVLFENTDPELVEFEVDTHWIEHAGCDSVEFIMQNADRIALLHAKEFRASDGADTAIGEGDVDFKKIAALSLKNHWPIVVEYEGENAFETVTKSAAYLRTLLSAKYQR